MGRISRSLIPKPIDPSRLDRLPGPSRAAGTLVDLDDLPELRREIERVLATLGQRKRQILELRYGLADPSQDAYGIAYTLEEVARVVGHARGWVRGVEGFAMTLLSHPRRSHTLARFLH